MKHRPKKMKSEWRIFWRQNVDGVSRIRWYTGIFSECLILQKVAQACKEMYWISAPGTFKQ